MSGLFDDVHDAYPRVPLSHQLRATALATQAAPSGPPSPPSPPRPPGVGAVGPAGGPSGVTVFNWAAPDGTSWRLRTVLHDGEPWFIKADVANTLGRSNGFSLTVTLDPDEKGIIKLETPGGPQNLATISESGFYRVVMRSNSPRARPFQDWVTRNVIPTIRKTGSYVMGEEKIATATGSELNALNEQMLTIQERKAALLEAMVEEARRRNMELAAQNAALETQVDRMTPAQDLVDRAFAGQDEMTIH